MCIIVYKAKNIDKKYRLVVYNAKKMRYTNSANPVTY